MQVLKIITDKETLDYLEKRNLLNQYLKAKKYILSGNLKSVIFKIREPKKDKIYSFRINKQFRALCKLLENDILIVFKISNHQE